MESILDFLVIGILLIGIICLAVISFKTMNVFERLGRRYENGLPIGCFSLEELAEKLNVIGLESKVKGRYVLVRSEKKVYKFILSDGRVYADLPVYRVAFRGLAFLFTILKKSGQLKKLVVYNCLMDTIAKAYCYECLADPTEDYERAKKFSFIYKGYNIFWVIFITIALIAISYHFITDPIMEVKWSTNEELKERNLGDFLDGYFQNPKWKIAESDDKHTVVEFNGTFPIKDKDGKEVEMSMKFISKKESDQIEFGKMRIYGEEVMDFIRKDVFKFIRNEYENKANNRKVIIQGLSMEDILELAKPIPETAEDKINKEKVKMVKEGVPNAYPEMTFGSIFDSYFIRPLWWIDNAGVVGNKDRIIFVGEFPEKDKNGSDVKFILEFYSDHKTNLIELGDMYVYDTLVKDEVLKGIVIKFIFEKEKSGFTIRELLELLQKNVETQVNQNDGTMGDNGEERLEFMDGIGNENELSEDSNHRTIQFSGIYSNTLGNIELKAFPVPEEAAYGLHVGYMTLSNFENPLLNTQIDLYEQAPNTYSSREGFITITVHGDYIDVSGGVMDWDNGELAGADGIYTLVQR